MQVPQEAFLPASGTVSRTLGWSTRGDERFVLLSANVASADKARPAAIVQLALDKSEDDRLLRHYRERLFVVLLLGSFAGSALGATLARRSLRPLKQMSEMASRVTASRLHERINPDRWPSELKLLAGTSMLFIARADNDDIRTEAVWFDVLHEPESLREFFDAMAEEKDVTVRCEGQARAWGDPVLFRRAVGNLLSKAMRFSPSGATVVLSAASTDGGGTRVLVGDEGGGVAAADTERVFDRFYRSDPSREHAGSGAGLGLAIVRSIMDLHRGSVSKINTGPQGTTVQLLFPQQENVSP